MLGRSWVLCYRNSQLTAPCEGLEITCQHFIEVLRPAEEYDAIWVTRMVRYCPPDTLHPCPYDDRGWYKTLGNFLSDRLPDVEGITYAELSVDLCHELARIKI